MLTIILSNLRHRNNLRTFSADNIRADEARHPGMSLPRLTYVRCSSYMHNARVLMHGCLNEKVRNKARRAERRTRRGERFRAPRSFLLGLEMMYGTIQTYLLSWITLSQKQEWISPVNIYCFALCKLFACVTLFARLCKASSDILLHFYDKNHYLTATM